MILKLCSPDYIGSRYGETWVYKFDKRNRLVYNNHPNFGGVAQLVRAPACHAGGRGFKSLHLRIVDSSLPNPISL